MKFSKRSRNNLFWLVAFLMLATSVSVVQTARAKEATEADSQEMAAYKKFDARVREQFGAPEQNPERPGDFQGAIDLNLKAIKELRSFKCRSKSVIAQRDSEVIDRQRRVAELQVYAGKFEQAGELYLYLSKCGKKDSFRLHNTPAQTSEYYLSQAARAFESGKQYGKSEKIYKQLVASAPDPSVSDYYVDLARVHEESGDSKYAETLAKNYMATNIRKANWRKVRAIRVFLKHLYLDQKRTQDAEKIEQEMNDDCCPVCHLSKSVTSIIYGYVTSIPPGRVAGGCEWGESSPQWWCSADKVEF